MFVLILARVMNIRLCFFKNIMVCIVSYQSDTFVRTYTLLFLTMLILLYQVLQRWKSIDVDVLFSVG
jgi:hypothetical protein